MSTLDLLAWSPPVGVECRREPQDRPSIEERFEQFRRANTHVLEEMLRLARERLNSGATYLSVKKLWEELRESLRVKRIEGFKLNNDFTAMAARWCIEQEPRLADVIELRRRKAK